VKRPDPSLHKLERRDFCQVPEVAEHLNTKTSKKWPFQTSIDTIFTTRKALAQCHINGQTIDPSQWPLYSTYCFDTRSTKIAYRHGLQRIPKDDLLARYYYTYNSPPINYDEVLEDIGGDYILYFENCLKEQALLSDASPDLIGDATDSWKMQQQVIREYDWLKQKAALDGVCFPIQGYEDDEYLEDTPQGEEKFDLLFYHLLNCGLLDQEVVPEQWRPPISDCFEELRQSPLWKKDMSLKEEKTVVLLKDVFRACVIEKMQMMWMNTAQPDISRVKSILDSDNSIRFKKPS